MLEGKELEFYVRKIKSQKGKLVILTAHVLKVSIALCNKEERQRAGWLTPLTPAPREAGLMDLCEFKAILVYKRSSRTEKDLKIKTPNKLCPNKCIAKQWQICFLFRKSLFYFLFKHNRPMGTEQQSLVTKTTQVLHFQFAFNSSNKYTRLTSKSGFTRLAMGHSVPISLSPQLECVAA